MTKDKRVERIARLIARRLGHNDENGMYWERYVCAATAIDDEYQPRLRPLNPDHAPTDWEIENVA